VANFTLPIHWPVINIVKEGAKHLNLMDGERTIVRFVGVYNASGTVLGELSYFVGARVGLEFLRLA
jgi:hypothetical protein